jgi:catechol 2,3-dioxygenase-like lactoylglutathione lyase family enzyme
MGYFAGEPSLPSSRDLAERAIKRPSSVIWLGHVCVTTTRFEEALGFYSGTLGLSLRTVERHPLHFDRLRAVLIDAEGRDVMELVEASEEAKPETDDPVVNQLGFRLPRRSWQALRARLETSNVPYEQTHGALALRDPDGIRLRIEPLGRC